LFYESFLPSTTHHIEILGNFDFISLAISFMVDPVVVISSTKITVFVLSKKETSHLKSKAFFKFCNLPALSRLA